MTNQNQGTHLSKSSSKRSIGPVTGAATLGGSLGLVIVWVASQFGVEVPEAVANGFVVILIALGGWIVKPGTGKRVSNG